MEIKEQPRLRFIGIDFPSIDLKSTQPFIETEDSRVGVEIQPKIFYPKDQINQFKIVMHVRLSAEGYFELKIVGIGTFEIIAEDITDKERKMLVNANAPAIVFPYIRSLIATLTSNIGNVITPILLPPRFFKGELEEMKEPKPRKKKSIVIEKPN
jgi:preprotein translocase subunit SecB